MKEFYTSLLDIIETDGDFNSEFDNFRKIIYKSHFFKNSSQIDELFYSILKIAENHHRTTTFFTRIEQILTFILKNGKTITLVDFHKFYQSNKRITFFLFQKKLIIPSKSLLDEIKSSYSQYWQYFYPVIRDYFTLEQEKKIKSESIYYINY